MPMQKENMMTENETDAVEGFTPNYQLTGQQQWQWEWWRRRWGWRWITAQGNLGT